MSPKRQHAGASWRNPKDAILCGAQRGGENRRIRENEEARAKHLRLPSIDELLAGRRDDNGPESPRTTDKMPDDDNQ